MYCTTAYLALITAETVRMLIHCISSLCGYKQALSHLSMSKVLVGYIMLVRKVELYCTTEAAKTVRMLLHYIPSLGGNKHAWSQLSMSKVYSSLSNKLLKQNYRTPSKKIKESIVILLDSTIEIGAH